jgi:hypothetical protein
MENYFLKSPFADIETITLRDPQHAYNIFIKNNFDLAPKTKFLYYVVFKLHSSISAEEENLKSLSYLVKRVDLPQFKADVDIKQQYNRKKVIQKRINYDDTRLVFHDDNSGLSRALMRDYFNYYYRDGTKRPDTYNDTYNPLNMYKGSDNSLERYGLDNVPNVPFFESITIYQLSRGEWFSYKLVNPLISQWGHDTVDYGEGAGIMENTLVIAYETVVYENGKIYENGQTSQDSPPGFKDSARLDAQSMLDNRGPLPRESRVPDKGILSTRPRSRPDSLSSSGPQSIFNLIETITNTADSFLQTLSSAFPGLPNTRTAPEGTSFKADDKSFIKTQLQRDRVLLNSIMKKTLSTGILSSSIFITDPADYDKLSSDAKAKLVSQLFEKIENEDPRLLSMIRSVLKGKKK